MKRGLDYLDEMMETVHRASAPGSVELLDWKFFEEYDLLIMIYRKKTEMNEEIRYAIVVDGKFKVDFVLSSEWIKGIPYA